MYNFIIKCYNTDSQSNNTNPFNLSIIADTIAQAKQKFNVLKGSDTITWDSVIAIQELRQIPNE